MAFIFHNIWDVILPIDELIFFKMVKTTNHSWIYDSALLCTLLTHHLLIHEMVGQSLRNVGFVGFFWDHLWDHPRGPTQKGGQHGPT
jgi:hypothetical protein